MKNNTTNVEETIDQAKESNDISPMFFLNKSKLFICKLKDLVCL
jgi:hypothetical protein